MKDAKYTVVFEPAPEGGYVAFVPSLPGCFSQGDTFEEANEMIKDAISGYIAVAKQEGIEIPQESGESVITKVAVSNNYGLVQNLRKSPKFFKNWGLFKNARLAAI